MGAIYPEIPAYGNLSTNYSTMVDDLRTTFLRGKTLPYEFRLKQLQNLRKLLQENMGDMDRAIHKDLRRHRFESSMEILGVISEVDTAIRLLSSWMAPDKLVTCLLFPNDNAFLQHNPYGVVLIMGTWNYPVALTLLPLIGAIAAGNCAVVKSSEVSPCTSSKLAELLPVYLDNESYRFIVGDAQEAVRLLQVKFDYIFATASTQTGMQIMAAAANYLTPLTLELGGKCPLYLHDSANIKIATKRILWGKLLNCGQTCIAPDYILCSSTTEKAFITCAKRILLDWYGHHAQSSSNIGRIINNHHFSRLQKLLENTKGDIVVGGNTDAADLWISPTIVVNVKETDVLMQNEIFGPILPIVRINSPEECVTYLNAKKQKPLSIYLFCHDNEINKLFATRTSSGLLSVNEVVLQYGWQDLPFGGVGESGMGKYYGKYSYDTFTHKKGVLVRDYSFITEMGSAVRYPPHTFATSKLKFFYLGRKHLHNFNIPRNMTIRHLIALIIALVAMSYLVELHK